jgi:hypothetical protein
MAVPSGDWSSVLVVIVPFATRELHKLLLDNAVAWVRIDARKEEIGK